ncbi:hypothetical protein [Pseudodesulfovibrio sp.]|uniref:hypothetical protein n=1 Tax=unclassified Pseudodesulfovibrio TaxID=2661612 RepID=UPI003AFFD98E
MFYGLTAWMPVYLEQSLGMTDATAGYIIVSLSPFAIGHMHESAGNWQGGMIFLTVAAVLMIGCGQAATNPHKR